MAAEMLAAERVARLAFVDEDERPRVLPVTFALAGGAIWSAIDEKPKRTAEPARVRRLRRRPEAALCVDVYSDDWSQLAWVQLPAGSSGSRSSRAPRAWLRSPRSTSPTRGAPHPGR